MGGYDAITTIMVQFCPFFSMGSSLGLNKSVGVISGDN